MGTVTDARIALATLRAGFPVDEIPTGVAVAIAESDGDPLAVNTKNKNGSTDRGIYQINSVHSDLLAIYDWRDVDQNAKMAFIIWGYARSWTPWATFHNEDYVQYLKRGQDAYRSLYRFTLRRYLFNHPQARSKDQLDHGPDVLALQRAIGMPHGDQDSLFGPLTERYVKEFQGRHRLAVDGVVGKQTCRGLGWLWAGPK